MNPTPEQARAKATALADARGPDGRLKAVDRDRCIEQWTRLFLAMEVEEYETYEAPLSSKSL